MTTIVKKQIKIKDGILVDYFKSHLKNTMQDWINDRTQLRIIPREALKISHITICGALILDFDTIVITYYEHTDNVIYGIESILVWLAARHHDFRRIEHLHRAIQQDKSKRDFHLLGIKSLAKHFHNMCLMLRVL